jgi:hypothetical protein
MTPATKSAPRPSFATRFIAEKFKKSHSETIPLLDPFALRALLTLAEARGSRTPIHPKLDDAGKRLAEAVKECRTPTPLIKPVRFDDFEFQPRAFEDSFGPSGSAVDGAVVALDKVAAKIRHAANVLLKAGDAVRHFDDFGFNVAIERLRHAVRRFEGAMS